MKRIILSLFVLVPAMLCTRATAQENVSEPADEGYKFTIVKEVPTNSVKDQSRSGTCWSFSGISFLEDELLRTGKGEYDLSEMWIVRHVYMDKAEKYVRMHGSINFAAGGAFHDVFNVIRKYGMVPEEVYGGLQYGLSNHDHSELDEILTSYVKAVVENKGRKLTSAWKAGFNAILDVYFGPLPQGNFTYKGKSYDPKSFGQSLGLNMDDYINITSYTHHPFYTSFILEIPDNWAWGSVVNVPMDEMMGTIDNAINNNYSVCWGADVSEKGFSYMKGIAVVPEDDVKNLEGTEQSRWVAMTERERMAALYKFDKPVQEKQITQQMRQDAFDNYETTDDHGMVITGIAKDQRGEKFYKVKNSWGTGGQIYDGYFYASYPFVAYKTMNVVVHKNAIPAALKSKLGIK